VDLLWRIRWTQTQKCNKKEITTNLCLHIQSCSTAIANVEGGSSGGLLVKEIHIETATGRSFASGKSVATFGMTLRFSVSMHIEFRQAVNVQQQRSAAYDSLSAPDRVCDIVGATMCGSQLRCASGMLRGGRMPMRFALVLAAEAGEMEAPMSTTATKLV
jgi:hypothetical protein